MPTAFLPPLVAVTPTDFPINNNTGASPPMKRDSIKEKQKKTTQKDYDKNKSDSIEFSDSITSFELYCVKTFDMNWFETSSNTSRFDFLSREIEEMMLLHYNRKHFTRSEYVMIQENRLILFSYSLAASIGLIFSFLLGPFILDSGYYFVHIFLWRFPIGILCRMLADLFMFMVNFFLKTSYIV